jgi:hypothetical protein
MVYSYVKFYLDTGGKKSIEFMQLLEKAGEKNSEIYTIEPIQKYLEFKFNALW